MISDKRTLKKKEEWAISRLSGLNLCLSASVSVGSVHECVAGASVSSQLEKGHIISSIVFFFSVFL
jgi:hypothetical protein